MCSYDSQTKVDPTLKKIKDDLLISLRKKQAFDIAACSCLVNFGKLSFPAYIYICYTNLLPKQSIDMMLVATITIIIIILLTSYVDNIRQRIIKKEKQIVFTAQRTHDAINYLSGKVNESDVGKLVKLNSASGISVYPDYDLIVIASDLVFALILSMIVINIGGGLILLTIGALKIATYRKNIKSALDAYVRNQNSQKYKYEKTVSYSRIMEGIDSMRLNNFEQKEIENHEKMQIKSAIENFNSNLIDSKRRNLSAFTAKLDVLLFTTIGATLVIGNWMTAAKLGACILLASKCLQPWNNFILVYARYKYIEKMKLRDQRKLNKENIETKKVSPSDLKKNLHGKSISLVNNENRDESFILETGKIYSIKDEKFGTDVDKFFESIFDGKFSKIQINEVEMKNIDIEEISRNIKMIDLSLPLIETNLLGALCCLDEEKNRRLALYLTFVCGLSEKIKKLDNGYESKIENDSINGLFTDDILAIKVIQSLATDPKILIIDLRHIIFKRRFVEYLCKLLQNRTGKMTIILNTNGGVFDKQVDSIINMRGVKLVP